MKNRNENKNLTPVLNYFNFLKNRVIPSWYSARDSFERLFSRIKREHEIFFAPKQYHRRTLNKRNKTNAMKTMLEGKNAKEEFKERKNSWFLKAAGISSIYGLPRTPCIQEMKLKF